MKLVAISEGHVVCHFHSFGAVWLGIFGEFDDEGLVGPFIWDWREDKFHVDWLYVMTLTSKLLRSMVQAFI